MEIKQASVQNLYADTAPLVPGLQSDYFFMAEPKYLEAKGKIGIILSPEKNEKEESYLRISDISHAGKAGAAGIKKDDIILSMNGTQVKDMEDIGIIMMDSKPGDTLQLIVSRQREEKSDPEKIELSVELSDLTKPPGHP